MLTLTDISLSGRLTIMINNAEQRLVSSGVNAVVIADLGAGKIHENMDFIPNFFNRELYAILLVNGCWKSIKSGAGIKHAA